MRTFAVALVASFALSLVGCGSEIAPRIERDSGTSAQCDIYPPGPYGTNVGDTIENHTFTGRLSGVTQDSPVPITLADFYAERNKGKKFLVLNVAAFWCSPCKIEARDLVTTVYPKYAPLGVAFMSVVLEKVDRTPTTPTDVDIWIKSFGLQFPAVSDPEEFVTKFFNKDSMPLNMVIDLSTMKIVSKTIGADLPSVEKQLDKCLAGSC